MNTTFSGHKTNEARGRTSADRFVELADQGWTRNKSRKLAISEGIDFNDEHWEVILFLRKRYLLQGLSVYAREIADELDSHFMLRGGAQYLYDLFPLGPVTQGSRIANIPLIHSVKDSSQGGCY